MAGKKMMVCGKSVLLAMLLAAGVQGSASASESFGIGGGQVNFSGQIYQPACRIQVSQANVTSECAEQGKFRQRALNVSTTRALAFNENRTEAQLAWLNAEKREGILTVSYR